jgi:hypothetical protein
LIIGEKMNINGIKTMLYKCTFFTVFVFCLISCNNSNKNSKAVINSDKIQETTATQETTGNDDELYSAWFKNILLTREYYYTESVEFINANSGGYALNENGPYNRKDILQMWKRLYSEETLHITEKHLVIGDAETTDTYNLESVKKDSNKYTLLLSNFNKEEYEVTLIDNGNSIVMTQCIAKSKDQKYNFILYSLNYNYVPCDEEKSKITESKVFAWIDEQVKELEK